ncbi:hypothetical protein [Rhizobium sp. FY34]|uniref:hypothetical protein n=1 Tax=Rhizobium sp. FY34 TaxID=2562309 RepID=UPI0010C00548|nr:hypothetical protein [Rhizobium sp. FY34]
MNTDVAIKAGPFFRTLALAAGLAGSVLMVSVAGPALALSGTSVPEAAPAEEKAPATGLPLPEPLVKPSSAQAATNDSGSDASTPKIEILQDLSKLPEAVRKTRQALVEAAASGDVERLRPLMAFDPDVMQQLEADGGNPVESFKSLSGDPDGLEILAIILDILQTGAAHVGIGTPDEMYVWPYFVGKPLAGLSAPEKVELLRIITAGDLVTMQETNNYNFYRVGIAVDGRWRLFAGGD